MLTYPINLVGLANRQCLVVGGGVIALRKVEGLLAAGARVCVVAVDAVAELRALADAEVIELRMRPFKTADLENVVLVIAATDDNLVNRRVSADALARGALVNVVDDPAASNFIVPAVVRRGELIIAVSTGGASPALARRLREELDARFGPEYAALVALLAELRPAIIARYAPGRPRLDAALKLLDADLGATIAESGLAAARAQARGLLELD